MRMRWKMTLATGVAAAMVAIAYAELVADIRTPRSSLTEMHAVGSSISIQMDDFRRAGEAMKEKYGPTAQTSLHTPGANLTTVVDGKVVEEGKLPAQFSDANGLFVVGPRGRLASTFPFRLDPRKVPAFGEKSESVATLKNRFGKEFPAKYLAFGDADATVDTCVGLSGPDLGRPGALLQIEAGTFCIVFWKGAARASMLIGIVLARGDPWMRPFAERICRSLTSIALARVAATDREPPPDYAACLLVDRPDRTGAAETLTAHVYEVRRDATLARMN
jgi:hypothetical protein